MVHGFTSLPAESQANSTTYVAVLTAMLGAIMFGLDWGNFGNVQGFQGFLDQWCKGVYDTGNSYACIGKGAIQNDRWQTVFIMWAASFITIGAAIGGLVVGPFLTSKHGRRFCISCGGGFCFLGCMLTSHLSFGIPVIFMAGRFVTGFAAGVCCFALPMYNSEISPPQIRGLMGSLFQYNVVVGGFVATAVTFVNRDWKVGMMLPGFAGAIVAVVVPFIPESPRWIMKKYGYKAGVEALRKVRVGDVQKEAQAIWKQIEEETGRVSYRELFVRPGLRKRVFIACYLQIAQQLTGVNAFLSYANVIFSGVGISDPFVFNAIWNAVMVFGCVSGLLLIDSPYGGRRAQLIGATLIMGPSLVIAGCSLHLQWPGAITMVMLCIFGFGFQVAWGIIPWVYPDEIFTMAEKESALSLTVFWQYAINAGVTIVTPHLMAWSKAGTLFTFGAFNMTNLIFVAAFIRETKGATLEDLPALFA